MKELLFSTYFMRYILISTTQNVLLHASMLSMKRYLLSRIQSRVNNLWHYNGWLWGFVETGGLELGLYNILFSGGFETYIRFDPIVDIYKSKLEVNIFTLFIRLGGIIGFCKNLLWVLLLSGSIVSLWKKIIPQAYSTSPTSGSVISVSEISE